MRRRAFIFQSNSNCVIASARAPTIFNVVEFCKHCEQAGTQPQVNRLAYKKLSLISLLSNCCIDAADHLVVLHFSIHSGYKR